jgi:Immunoglobulin domain/Immunoglobulin I-set domain
MMRRTLALALAFAAASAFAQTIPNPSFEADTYTVFPGYISGNGGVLTGWTANNNDRAGINPGGGTPFADNGTIPDGANVAFIQSGTAGGTTLSTAISGLTAGQVYKVSFRCNARNGQFPILKVEIDGTLVESATIASVGGALPYRYFVFDFTATDVTHNLTLRNDAAGDHTVVVDDFRIGVRNSGWSYAAWSNDATSGVDGSKTYSHAFNFGSAANAVINGITFTGRAGANPGLGGSFAMAGLPSVFVNDGNNVTGPGASRTLANDFIYGGGGNNVLETLTINGLFPGGEYIATIYSVGWEDGPVRAATFSVGTDRLTVNQDRFGNNNGIRFVYHFVASASSTTISYEPLQAATIHTYGFSVQQVSLPSAPTISKSPASQCVGDGSTVNFSVTAAGSDPLSYEWRKDDVTIPGEAGSTYTIPSVTTGDAGTYTVVVSNPSGSVTSSPAILQVGIPITNPSFEADTFTVFPYYVSGNTPITGWNSLGNHGVNTAAGPFADNGVIPDGNQVAFMQGDGALSQLLTGFIPGADYYVIYYENARTTVTPAIEVKISDTTVVQPHLRPPVGGANPYVKVKSEVYTAESDTLQLSFIKSNPLGGDSTALVDYVCVLELPAGTAPSILTPPANQIVSIGQPITLSGAGFGSQPLIYQWAKDGTPIPNANGHTYTIAAAAKSDEGVYTLRVSNSAGDAESAGASVIVFEPIPDLYSTGLDPSRAPLADGASDPHYTLLVNPDGTGANAIVEDSSVFPIVAGPWIANSASSKWIGPRFNTAASAVGAYTYRTTIDLTDRDPSTVVILGRWSVDNAGLDIRVNGVSTGNPQNPGFNVWTPFAIGSSNATFVAGVNTIDFIAENQAAPGYTGLKVEILASNVRIPPGILPVITGQPQSRTGVVGDTILFSVAASGSQPLSYQWQKDGVDLPGQTATTLTLINVQTSDMGVYTVHVFNDAGDAFSDPATLCLNYAPVPGVVFGTGTDDSGALLADGSVDLHYILSQSVDPAYQGPDAIVADSSKFPIVAGPWIANGPKSKWIAPTMDQSVGNLGGDYTYQTFFDLSGYDLSQIRIAGSWAVDNTGTDILVNGVSTGITSPGFGGMTSFTISGGALVAGPNVLDFKMNNADVTINPTALRVDLELQRVLSPTISFTKSGTDLIISWSPTTPCQRLMAADSVEGPYVTINGGANNPFHFDMTTSDKKFFKVVQ